MIGCKSNQLHTLGDPTWQYKFFDEQKNIIASCARFITNFGTFVFGNLGCVIFFMMVSVCKARQARFSEM